MDSATLLPWTMVSLSVPYAMDMRADKIISMARYSFLEAAQTHLS